MLPGFSTLQEKTKTRQHCYMLPGGERGLDQKN